MFRIADLTLSATEGWMHYDKTKQFTADKPGCLEFDIILDPTLLHRLHKHGYTVWVWTVNQPWLMRLLRWLGVDGITTDRPDLAAATMPTK